MNNLKNSNSELVVASTRPAVSRFSVPWRFGLPRSVIRRTLNQVTGLVLCLMVWQIIRLVANVESPVVVVLTGSMEPAMYRGDLLFLINQPSVRYKAGDIVVYSTPKITTPIVHRVVQTHGIYVEGDSTRQFLLTKGDNNPVDDVAFYEPGKEWVERSQVLGRVVGHMPYIGYPSILVNAYPQLLYIFFGIGALLGLIATSSPL